MLCEIRFSGQMLKMQDIPCDEFVCNARGMDLTLNFPTSCCTRKKLYQQPASENETKALIRIFQEYGGRGLLVFCGRGKKVIHATGRRRDFPTARNVIVLQGI